MKKKVFHLHHKHSQTMWPHYCRWKGHISYIFKTWAVMESTAEWRYGHWSPCRVVALRGVALMMMLLPSHIRSNERTKMDHFWRFATAREVEGIQRLEDLHSFCWGNKRFCRISTGLHCHERDAGMYGAFNEFSWTSIWFEVARSPTLSCPLPNDIQSCVTSTVKTAHNIHTKSEQIIVYDHKERTYLITYITSHCISLPFDLLYYDCPFFPTQGHPPDNQPLSLASFGPSIATCKASGRAVARLGEEDLVLLLEHTLHATNILGEGKSSSKVCWGKDMFVSMRVVLKWFISSLWQTGKLLGPLLTCKNVDR